MRKVTRGATFCLDHRVLVYERPGGLRVAFRANRIHLRRGTKVLAIECAVGVVTVGALDKALFHLVVVGHVELRLRTGMALEAEGRLRGGQQLIFNLAVVNAVAGCAAHIVFAVGGPLEIGVLTLVAGEAPGVHFFGGRLGGIEDLGSISAAFDVSFARSVAALAGNTALSVGLGEFGMRIRSESFAHFLVTRRAGILPDKISLSGLRLAGRGGTRTRTRRSSRADREQKCRNHQQKKDAQPCPVPGSRSQWLFAQLALLYACKITFAGSQTVLNGSRR